MTNKEARMVVKNLEAKANEARKLIDELWNESGDIFTDKLIGEEAGIYSSLYDDSVNRMQHDILTAIDALEYALYKIETARVA